MYDDIGMRGGGVRGLPAGLAASPIRWRPACLRNAREPPLVGGGSRCCSTRLASLARARLANAPDYVAHGHRNRHGDRDEHEQLYVVPSGHGFFHPADAAGPGDTAAPLLLLAIEKEIEGAAECESYGYDSQQSAHIDAFH